MAEILCRMRVNVWASDRPEVSWIGVTRRTRTRVIYTVRKAVGGRVVEREQGIPRSWLERVNPDFKHRQPGVCEIYWCQADTEPITGGVGYNMALISVLDRIDRDMQDAAIRVRDMQEALYADAVVD